MLKTIIIAVSTLLANVSMAKVNCKRHKIYCHIKQLRPKMPKKEAMQLSNLLYKYSKKYGTDPHISVAIGMQESGLKNIHSKTSGLVAKTTCFSSIYDPRIAKSSDTECVTKLVPTTIHADLGMFQFHHSTMKRMNIDENKVFNHDLEYIVETHVKILKLKIKKCKSRYDSGAWACYNSSNAIKRRLYQELVERYLPN